MVAQDGMARDGVVEEVLVPVLDPPVVKAAENRMAIGEGGEEGEKKQRNAPERRNHGFHGLHGLGPGGLGNFNYEICELHELGAVRPSVRVA